MNQIPNIEETHNTREIEEIVAQLLLRTYDRCFVRGQVPPEVGSSIAHYDLFLKEELTNLLHHQLQKARGEMLHKLHLCAIGKYEGDALENVKAQIKEFQDELDHQPDRSLNQERE